MIIPFGEARDWNGVVTRKPKTHQGCGLSSASIHLLCTEVCERRTEGFAPKVEACLLRIDTYKEL